MVYAGPTLVSETVLSDVGNSRKGIPFRLTVAIRPTLPKGSASASSQTHGKHKVERAREGEKWGGIQN